MTNEPINVIHEKLDLLGKGCNRLLEFGSRAGENAALITCRHSECDVFGITHSGARLGEAGAV